MYTFDHLNENKISYFCHMKNSLYYSMQSFKACIIFIFHAIYPDSFQYTGSAIISELNQSIINDQKYKN
jgi:hypothetical protein